MKLTHRFAEMTPDKRPQDPHMDGPGFRFETLDHGGEISRQDAASHRADRRRGPVLHLRSDHAERQGRRQPGLCARCGG